jgi:lipoprotein-releasing system ATP-binding protein
MTELLVSIRDLEKSYWLDGREIPVLRGVSVDIDAGERISIIGRSGSGKSTFLHVLGTLDTPSRGQVMFQGQDVFRRSSAELASVRNRTVGFVFQFHHLLPEFSARENVMMPAMIQRLPTAQAIKQAEEMLEIVGLSHRIHHRPGELSGGEQQRVAIARALVLRPKLLLADEPTGNLDETSARGIHELIDRLNRETGLTVVLVTHSSALARGLPRQLEMIEGRLAPVGAGRTEPVGAAPGP